jgi:hypothetical protein
MVLLLSYCYYESSLDFGGRVSLCLPSDEPPQPINEESGSGRLTGEKVKGGPGLSRVFSTLEVSIKGPPITHLKVPA